MSNALTIHAIDLNVHHRSNVYNTLHRIELLLQHKPYFSLSVPFKAYHLQAIRLIRDIPMPYKHDYDSSSQTRQILDFVKQPDTH